MSDVLTGLPVLIGFFIAAVVITAMWFVDWRHYIRYWHRSGPPYSPRTILIARGFFLACLVGSAMQLVVEILANRPSTRDLGYSLLDGLLIVAVFFAIDVVFRLYWGRPKDPMS